MIPVIRSLDSLLNRFDELSQKHANLASTFETNFSDIQNPLHDVSRDENEQRKTAENLRRGIDGDDDDNDQLGSFGTVEEFNRRITKSRGYNRPPSYSSNDSSSFYHRIPSRSSWATGDSAPPVMTSNPSITQERIGRGYSQTAPATSNDTLTESMPRQIIRPRTKFSIENSPPNRRNARSAVTAFTMETAIRLSRPKRYNRLPEPIIIPKHVHRRPKPSQNRKKETLETSATSIPRSPRASPPVVLLRTASPLSKRTQSSQVRKKTVPEPSATFLARSPPSSPPLVPPRTVSPLGKRTKSSRARKREVPELSNIPISRSPRTTSPLSKQTYPFMIKSSLKKYNDENKSATEDSKQFPMSNYPRPAIILAPPPTICLTFPMQPELKSSRVVVIPKSNPITALPVKKTMSIFTNKRTIIPPNRMMYLFT